MSSELYVVPRFWDKEMTKFNEEGFEGWIIFGVLGTFNFLYYSDIFAEKYLTSNEFNTAGDGTTTAYGGVGSAFFSNLAFKSVFGIGQWFRVFLNWTSWFIVMFVWLMTLIPDNYIAEVWLFNIGAYFMGTLHLLRTAFLVIIWALAIAIYDNYTSYYRVYDYFSAQDAWGHRMKRIYSQTTGWQETAAERTWVDYELEMATCVGLFVGIPLLAPRYHAALKKVEAKKEVIQNKYLNDEKKWRTDTLQKIAVRKAELSKIKSAERKAQKAAKMLGRGAIDGDDNAEDTGVSVDPEEEGEWL